MQGMKFDELRQFYIDHFSLGFLNTEASNKLVLIGLLCKLTKQLQSKKPGVTFYQVITKLTEKMALPEEFIWALAIICEDLSYGATKFPDFGVEEKNIIPTLKSILSTYLPF